MNLYLKWMHRMLALLQEPHDSIHGRPNCLSKDDQEHAFVVQPYRSPGGMWHSCWLGVVSFILHVGDVLLRHTGFLGRLMSDSGSDGLGENM
jgi:hypothetical protein